MQEKNNKFNAWHGDLFKFEKMHGHGTNNAIHMELKRKKTSKFKGFNLKTYLVGWCRGVIIRCVWTSIEIIDVWVGAMFQQLS